MAATLPIAPQETRQQTPPRMTQPFWVLLLPPLQNTFVLAISSSNYALVKRLVPFPALRCPIIFKGDNNFGGAIHQSACIVKPHLSILLPWPSRESQQKMAGIHDDHITPTMVLIFRSTKKKSKQHLLTFIWFPFLNCPNLCRLGCNSVVNPYFWNTSSETTSLQIPESITNWHTFPPHQWNDCTTRNLRHLLEGLSIPAQGLI